MHSKLLTAARSHRKGDVEYLAIGAPSLLAAIAT